MDKVRRKVNQVFTMRRQQSATDTASSAGFGDPQLVVAAVGMIPNQPPPLPMPNYNMTQHHENSMRHQSHYSQRREFFYQNQMIPNDSTERRRRRRRRSRPRRNNNSGADERSSSRRGRSGEGQSNLGASGDVNKVDQTLRQKAVARLKMFNFTLNWDLQPCKPCGPKSGNILTRRLCRNRRREDNELYRSNSFKFERFDRNEELNSRTLGKQISVCDDYSLPIDFIKKRPSSIAECIPDNNWPSPSTLSEHVTFLDQTQHYPGNSIVLPTVETFSLQKQPYYSESKKKQKPLQKQEEDNEEVLQIEETAAVPKPETSKKSGKEKETSSKRRRRKHSNKHKKKKSDSSVPNSSEDERVPFNSVPELNSPDSINDDILSQLSNFKSPKRSHLHTSNNTDSSKPNPSPYYYSDLLKNKEQPQPQQQQQPNNTEPAQETAKFKTSVSSLKEKEKDLPFKSRKSSSLDTPAADKEVCLPKRYSITEEGVRIIRCESPSSTTSDDSDCSECQKRREWHAQALAVVRAATSNLQSNAINFNRKDEIDGFLEEGETSNQIDFFNSMPPGRLLGPAICACAAPDLGDDTDELFRPRSIFYVHQQGLHECADCSVNENLKSLIFDDDMSNVRTRKIYETAFDAKIAKSDDDLDEVDRITNHSATLFDNEYKMVTSQSKDSCLSQKSDKKYRSKHSKSKANQDVADVKLMKEIENLKIEENIENIVNANITVPSTNQEATEVVSQLPLRGYTPSPPSTAPLPMKFPSKHERYFMNSIRSAPNLPSSNVQHPRLKDLRLDVNSSLRNQEVTGNSDGSMIDSSYDSPKVNNERPRSVIIEAGRVFELKRSHLSSGDGRRNYSSTESMATSSSGGSMESLRSSTSEGNRSTTSTESRHSSTLSSHSSDSGPSIVRPLRAPVLIHPKLHILSPISDKSSQEPVSEVSENMKNNSQKQTPDENTEKLDDTNVDNIKMKKRPPPNKTLLLIAGDEIQGSDSGISLHSRDDAGKNKLGLNCDKIDSATGIPQDLKDLPFDMPKLRRRRIALNQNTCCTSGSATSVDLGDLPFDMPKLRRRLRVGGVNMILPANLSNNATNNTLNINNNNNINLSTDTSGSQASSSHSMQDDRIIRDTGMFRQNLTLNLNDLKSSAAASVKKPFGTLDLHGLGGGSGSLNLNFGGYNRVNVDLIDVTIPLDRQGWYHGAISRVEAENTLRPLSEGSFLVRNSESTRQDYSLSLKSAKGFMHMRIQRNNQTGQFILGQFSRPFDSIPEMIRHFCLNRLPVRGAEHMCLLEPVIAQLL